MLLVAFLTATVWIGPFWMLMLLQPFEERTKRWMEGPWFVLGPLVAYLIVLAMNLGALNDMMGDGTLSGVVSGLAEVLGTDDGAVLAWTHFVIGDIIVTRWIWKRSVEMEMNKTVAQVAILFGVMLMPVGLAIHFITIQINKDNNTHS
ncbi:MAG: abscisic acid-deficient protein Aba4 family protein [Candidatus Thermoplasmatota archaeon]|nr:abscisic acid-deficient protein Aba4 family protein [Candidatus Thermoplasmatota archaeon]